MDELKKELNSIEIQLKELPAGYISKKNIYGKTKYYHQWTENGCKKSKYLNDIALNSLQIQIEKRKELQKRKREIMMLLSKEEVRAKKPRGLNTSILLGKDLELFSKITKKYKKRICYKTLQNYLYGDIQDKVLILYGLRRTGKTTLIRQSIASMNSDDLNKAAFIQVRPGNTLSLINEDLKILLQNGYKYVFIDEVTLMEDFIEGAALFSDVYAACGMKIVLSGTDSLGFLFSCDEQLYDRSILIHTTFIPYKEFEEVLGIAGIDEYIRFAGTMSLSGEHYNELSTFVSKKSTDEYVDSAIAKNIQHSLKYYQYEGHFRALQELYENHELTSAINRIVEDINHQFTLEVLTRDFISHDLGISAKNLRNDRFQPNDVLDKINKEQVVKRLKEVLNIRNKEEQTINILDVHKKEIKEYLDLLDLTVDIDILFLPSTNQKNIKTVFSQPGMRYSQAEELIRSLLKDEVFQNISLIDRTRIIERILSEVKGRMMEDIVLLETKLAYKNKEVFKLQFPIGEFDMVVADFKNNTCEVYEIKYSKEKVKEQGKNLTDLKKCQDTEFRFGKITKKCIIYRGQKMIEDGIEYINVEEYLKSLYFENYNN